LRHALRAGLCGRSRAEGGLAVPALLRRGLKPRLEARERLAEARGVAPRSGQLQGARRAVVDRLRAPGDAIAHKQREDVVPVFALRFRDVHLEPVAEVEEGFGARAVVDQAIER